MKKTIGAKIENGIIVNKGVFRDTNKLPDGWIDVTNTKCDIGDPVIDGVPIPKPSEAHVVDGGRWVVDPKKQAEALEREANRKFRIEIFNAKANGGFQGKSLEQCYECVDESFRNVPDSPVKTATVDVFKKILPYIL